MGKGVEIKHYKVLSLAGGLSPNAVYYVLNKTTGKVETYITDLSGVPIPLNDLQGSLEVVHTTTGTAVTGTALNPKINIETFLSTQLGNLIELSSEDGKLLVKPLVSSDGSISITPSESGLQLQLSTEIQDNILDIQNDIVNLQVEAQSLEDTKFNNPTGSYTQYLDGLGVPTDFPDLNLKQDVSEKGQPNGYAPLNELTKIASQYLNIVNDLVSGGASALLSAEQGKTLQGQINGINVILTSDNVNLDTVQELVDAIEVFESSLNTILVNDLTTGGITKALTAEMGKELKNLYNALALGKQNTLTAGANISITGDTISAVVPTIIYGTTANTSAQGNDSRILNGQTAFGWGNHSGLYAPTAHTHTFASLTNKPTNLFDFGITLGTVNRLSKFTATGLVDSQIFDDGTNVGIGTTTPTTTLDVRGNIRALIDFSTTNDVLRPLTVTRTTTGTPAIGIGTGIAFDVESTLNTVNTIASIDALVSQPYRSGELIFRVSQGSNPVEALRINYLGNVGIGTTTPTAKLQVKGSGTTNTTTSFRVENSDASTSILVLDNGRISQTLSSFKATSFGTDAGKVVASTSAYWTAFGNSAGLSSTTGGYWTSVGASSGGANTTGQFWSSLGFFAGRLNVTGGNWTALGAYAGEQNTSGNDWIAIGYASARNYSGGTTVADSFSTGVYIGANTKVGIAGAQNEIVIGYLAEGVGSNSVVLGNDAITKTLLKGNVLIGTPTDIPTALLNLSSTTKGFLAPRMTSTQKLAIVTPTEGLQVYDLTTKRLEYFDGTSWFAVNSSGTGGAYLPLSGGTVTGNTFFQTNVYGGSFLNEGSSGGGGLIFSSLGVSLNGTASAPIIKGSYNANTIISPTRDDINNYGGVVIRGGGQDRMFVAPTGNVGIGTTTDIPTALLNISSTTKGFLIPRMTNTQMLAIVSPVEGLQVYDLTNKKLSYFDGVNWVSGGSGGGGTTLSGTTNKIVKFLTPTTVGDSVISEVVGGIQVAGIIESKMFDGEVRSYQNDSIFVSLKTADSKAGIYRSYPGSFFTYIDTSTGSANLASVIDGAPIRFLSVNTELAQFTSTGSLLVGTTTELPSSKLTVQSTTQGVIFPRMTTTQKLAIVSPTEGLEVYDLTLHQKSYYNGTSWVSFSDNDSNVVKNIVKEASQGANVTGTTLETILYSTLIPANTFKDGDSMTLFSRVGKSVQLGTLSQRVKINTSNTLTGATQIVFNFGIETNRIFNIARTFTISNGFLTGFSGNTSASSDITNNTNPPQFNAFNPTIDNYIFITGQLSNASDTMYHMGTKITN